MGRSFKESVEIFGTDGTIHIKPEERPSLRVYSTKSDLPNKLNDWVSPVLDYVPPEDRGRSLHFNGEENPWVGLHRHFVNRVRDGKPVITDGTFGRQVVEVILAGYESAREGRTIRLQP